MLLHEEEAFHSYQRSSSWLLLQADNIDHHASPAEESRINNIKRKKPFIVTLQPRAKP